MSSIKPNKVFRKYPEIRADYSINFKALVLKKKTTFEE